MKKLVSILLMGSILLNGCATTELHSQTLQEQVQSIVYSQPIHKAYIVGTHYDYELDICTMNGSVGQTCLNNVSFLQNKQNQSLIENIAIESVSYRTDLDRITGDYVIYLPLSDKQYQNFKQQSLAISPVSPSDVAAYNQKYHKNYQPNELYQLPIYFSGKVVTLQNKDEILTKGQLKTPLTFDLHQGTLTEHRSIAPIVKGAAGLVIAPVGLVIMAPFFLIIASQPK
ncbi:hypothetical protein ACOR62_00320 [Neisseria lisongii]|uniref:Lipoprotein n=1 Tax=Neisseria lisongii TaxID=2912188 RepID=A0AAW5AKB4_9NEIS|nr:hypothetical protein [Neisseria lisongii]MCF7528924.1 hypothetical protein [Neisseria lisongii]